MPSLQQILLRPCRVLGGGHAQPQRRLHLDALAAQVGGIGIAPGANMSDSVACFEATHGTAPKYAGKDYVNPAPKSSSGRDDAAPHGLEGSGRPDPDLAGKAIGSKKVTTTLPD